MTNLSLKQLIQTEIFIFLNNEFKDLDISINEVEVTSCKNKEDGDYASNIALKLAKKVNQNPIELSTKIQSCISNKAIKEITKIEVAGPGFINFFISTASKVLILQEIMQKKDNYGKNELGCNKNLLLEFVSANPTGPLHVGHGRGAVFGDCLSNLLRFSGYNVTKEYYVNDAGKQIMILSLSVLYRYHELINENFKKFFKDFYQGDYIWDISAHLHREYGDIFFIENLENIKLDDLDQTILEVKNNLKDKFETLREESVKYIIEDINKTLVNIDVNFDNWYLESDLLRSDMLKKTLDKLESNNMIEKKDGALWFKSKDNSDDTDRVLVKSNGDHTYFLSDIAYHQAKSNRDYDVLLNVWGADHHGYVPRIKSAFHEIKKDRTSIEILLIQFANLYRGKTKLQMSTRSGQFIKLDELINEIGKDAIRFFYLMRKNDQHLDFDIELAKKKTSDNPVFYIQYAHARICSVLEQILDRKINISDSNIDFEVLSLDEEVALIDKLRSFPIVIEAACRKYEPHIITNYQRELAQLFHSYYNKCNIIKSNEELRNARVYLLRCMQIVLINSSNIIGISLPEKM
jgi:arginyl-tRNA synthetase